MDVFNDYTYKTFTMARCTITEVLVKQNTKWLFVTRVTFLRIGQHFISLNCFLMFHITSRTHFLTTKHITTKNMLFKEIY